MSHTTARAWATPKSTGEQFLAAEANAIDDGQFYAWNRFGDTFLAGNSAVYPNAFTLNFDASDNAASAFAFYLGAQDLVFNIGGAGNVVIPAGDLELSGTDYPVLGSRTVYRVQNVAAHDASTAGWIWATPYYSQHVDNTVVSFPLSELVDGATLTEVRVTVMGQTTAGFSSLPTTMPKVKVYKVDGSTGAVTQLGSTATDASGTVGAFNGIHHITVSGLSQGIDQSAATRLFVTVLGGDGNFVADELSIIGIRASFTCTLLTPG